MDSKNIVIEQITTFSHETAEAISHLAKQIGKNYKPFTDNDLQEIVSSPQSFLFVARNVPTQQIVGMIMVFVFRIPYVKKAYMDDLIVDHEFRGKGIGKLLMKKAAEIAKEKGAAYADFTSRPQRIEGNSLYEKLGFKKRDTNVYRLIFDYGEI